jgi:hypothetical protein
MHGFLQQLRLSLALHFRNRMALFYGYLFPTIFLVASGCSTGMSACRSRGTWASC